MLTQQSTSILELYFSTGGKTLIACDDMGTMPSAELAGEYAPGKRIGQSAASASRIILRPTPVLFKKSAMQPEHFDLNDILREPTDQQLDALMAAVAAEAQRRAEVAHQVLMARLRAELAAANRPPEPV